MRRINISSNSVYIPIIKEAGNALFYSLKKELEHHLLLNESNLYIKGKKKCSNEKSFTKVHLVFIVCNSMNQSNCSTGIADRLLHEIY